MNTIDREILPKTPVEEFFNKTVGPSATPEQKINAVKELLEHVLEQIMVSERELHLKQSKNNKGNGYYNRNLTAGSWNLNLDVPRDRNNEFRPLILLLPEKYKRTDASYVNLLMSLIVNGYSESQLHLSLKQLGLPYSDSDINFIKNQLIERLNDFKQKELPSNAFAIFIDAYHTQIKDNNKIQKACVYSVLGIDLEGKKDIYGFYTFFGNESSIVWRKVFSDLIQRGLKKIVVVISDDFPSISDAIKSFYPLSDHQLCFVHFMRNIRKNMNNHDASAFNKELQSIKFSRNLDDGMAKFDTLCASFSKDYKNYINIISSKKEKILCFLKFPEDIRRYVYTTNAVENINSRIEQIRYRLGGYFQSVNVLEINMLLQIERLQQDKWKNPMPKLNGKSYDMNQLFNVKSFDSETQHC